MSTQGMERQATGTLGLSTQRVLAQDEIGRSHASVATPSEMETEPNSGKPKAQNQVNPGMKKTGYMHTVSQPKGY